MVEWYEVNICDSCEYHCIEYRCLHNSHRGRLIHQPKQKCKGQKVSNKAEVDIESRVPLEEVKSMQTTLYKVKS